MTLRNFLKTLQVSLSAFMIFVCGDIAYSQNKKPIYFDENFDKLRLELKNGCYNTGYVFGSKFSDSLSSVAMYKSSRDTVLGFYDTFVNQGEIKGVSLSTCYSFYTDVEDTSYMAVITDSFFYHYWIGPHSGYNDSTIVINKDSARYEDLVSVHYSKPYNNLILLYGKEKAGSYNLEIRKNSNLSIVQGFILDFKPVTMHKANYYSDKEIYILGIKNDQTVLAKVDLESQSDSILYTLPETSKNPVGVYESSNDFSHVYVLSHPKANNVSLTKCSLSDSSLYVTNLYSYSQMNAWELGADGYFYFQPEEDPMGGEDHKKVFIVDLEKRSICDTLNFNQKVEGIGYPKYGGFSSGIFYFSSANTGQKDPIYLADPYNYSVYDTLYSKGSTKFFFNEIRCSMGISEENPLDVKVDHYPNPGGNFINLNIARLPSTSECMIIIRNNTGKVMISKTAQVKSETTFSLNNYSPGMYFIEVWLKDQRMYSGKFVKVGR